MVMAMLASLGDRFWTCCIRGGGRLRISGVCVTGAGMPGAAAASTRTLGGVTVCDNRRSGGCSSRCVCGGVTCLNIVSRLVRGTTRYQEEESSTVYDLTHRIILLT